MNRCCFLDRDGIRCRNPAKTLRVYHGDNELYDHREGAPQWVAVPMCSKHEEGTDRYIAREYKRRKPIPLKGAFK